ncbi:hydantoinase/oxoprolinase family protein [Aquamicrobium sp. LC103]|uniref:hydantoinase/oxoprolinase family protein n=1 Tax=Aquamicrobium sp. LC103 TaxID=1120658 RepID=UPI00063E6F90|nr:hydantoinase/oxoprolinase family protein [Aquamicrobium sp. LC103]TKT78250.1 hydantoinase/oxoprolinase family protein [Aquamicrobium sp. LC103]
MRVGVEIGGTFTDLVWMREDGTVTTGKVPSTPLQVEQAVLDAIVAAGVPLDRIGHFSHGSTIATNSLLTQCGAMTGLLTTEGFRDVVEIGTHDRFGNIYTSFYNKPRPPLRRRDVREIAERVDGAGNVLTPLDEEQAWSEIQALLDEGVRSIAICLLHSYRAPQHERQLRDLIRRRAPHVDVFTSHEVSPEFREYERTVTTVVNAFVGPMVKGYVDRLGNRLREGGYDGTLRIIQSNGGIMPASAAGENAVRMLLSGPAAGIRAAIWFAQRNGISDILTLDMGGTSTDVAIAKNLDARIVPELIVDGLPIRTTALDMATVGAGGGSIASIDPGGFLNVGPASAGAFPGPACYGRGGDLPTVTDAQLVAGLLRPQRFFGGQMELSMDRARDALGKLELSGGLEERADAVLRMVNSNMAAAVRLVSTARGIDPREFTLVAYGGGGPLHGAMVADEVGMRKVLIPWSPGISSAFGLLVADLIVDVVQARIELLSDESLNFDSIEELKALCVTEAEKLDLAEGTYEVQAGLDLRYAGQGYELTLWRDMKAATAREINDVFQTEHKARYGYARGNLPVQVVNLRARIIQKSRSKIETPVRAGDGVREAAVIRLAGKTIPATFMSRSSLLPGQSVGGPVVLEEPTSTTVVPEGWCVSCLESGDLLLEKL